jgi:hypothetical protein
MNACGRELNYVQRRDEIRKKNFDRQGQELTEILAAKIAWLNDPELGQKACEGLMRIAVTDTDTIKLWQDPSRPTNCQDQSSNQNDVELEIHVKVTPDCMRRQVNEAIGVMEKHSQMGTNGPPPICLLGPKELSHFFKGDFDVNVRELTRLLYMGRIGSNPVLKPSTIDYMYKNLLVAKGGLSEADYSEVAGCDEPAGDDRSSPDEWANNAKLSQSNLDELISALGDLALWLSGLELELDAMSALELNNLSAFPLLLVMNGENPGHLPLFDLRVPETENHRLMIESSKYLINNAMIRELEAPDKSTLAAVGAEQKEVREWLLRDLQRIEINDFDEYNSRPYTQFSLESILNLYDFSNLTGFSDDQEMCTASAIVLDLSAAKFVAGSNRGRRIAPYRRRAQYDGTDPKIKTPANLYNMTEGADHEVVRAFLLAGQTQLVPDGVPADQTGGAVNTAVSDYRLPDALLEIVVDRDSTSTAFPFSQTIRHGGIESYYASRAFTMSLGGIQTPVALSFYGLQGLNVPPFNDDRGIAMPTSIIPTIAGSNTTDEVFSLLGDGTGAGRSENLCGWQGFICGINPHTADQLYGLCTNRIPSLDDSGTIVDYVFVNSATCFPDKIGPHFYLAAKVAPCPDTFCKKGLSYGLMEIAETDAKANSKAEIDKGFDTFRGDRRTALSNSVPDKEGNGFYKTATGALINYQIKEAHSHISSVNGVSHPQFSITPKFITQGDIINSEGNGKIHITNPSKGGDEILTIDFTDPLHPQLTPNHCRCEKEPLPIRCQKQPPVDTGPVVH